MQNYVTSGAYGPLFWVLVLLKSGYCFQNSRVYMNHNDLEEALCLYQGLANFKSGICPSKQWSTASMTPGRLGNKFEAYMSLWVWAREHPEELVLQPHCLFLELSELCEKLSVPILHDMHCGSNWPVHILPMSTLDGATIARYFQPLRHELRLKKKLRRKSKATLASEELKMSTTHRRTGARKKAWWVSIHVRRTDYIRPYFPARMIELNITVKVRYPPPVKWYVRAAVRHLKRAPKGAPRALMLLSDETPWLQEVLAPALRSRLGNSTHVAVLDTTVDDALALLAAAKSSIMDYGTFGMVGAFLAGGNTTVYPLPFGISNHMNLVGHLPHWTVQNLE